MRKPTHAATFAVAAILLGATVTACSNSSSSAPLAVRGRSVAASDTAAAEFPATVHAANGDIRIAARPTSIMSLSPTATEMLYAIGAGAQVKAVDEYSDYPPQAPRTNLGEVDPSVEAIVSYHPDLVVMGPGDSKTLNHALAGFAIPVLYEPAAANLDSAYSQFEQLGEATGHRSQAVAEVTRIKSRIASIVRHVHKPAGPATYYYELEQTYYSVTSSTFIGKLLGLFGLKDIADAAKGAASSGGYPQLSAEFIIRANPQYIFLADTICCGQSAVTVSARPGWSTLRAVRNGDVVALNDDIASRWGPRIVNLLQTVADALDSKHTAAS